MHRVQVGDRAVQPPDASLAEGTADVEILRQHCHAVGDDRESADYHEVHLVSNQAFKEGFRVLSGHPVSPSLPAAPVPLPTRGYARGCVPKRSSSGCVR